MADADPLFIKQVSNIPQRQSKLAHYYRILNDAR